MTIGLLRVVSAILICISFCLSGINAQSLMTSLVGGDITACASNETISVTFDNDGMEAISDGTFTIMLPTGITYEGNLTNTGDVSVSELSSTSSMAEFQFTDELDVNEEIIFTIEISADCNATGDAIEIDLMYNEDGSAFNLSMDITSYNLFLSDLMISSTPSPQNIAIGSTFSITNTVSNSGNGGAMMVTYCIEDNNNVDLVSLTIDGSPGAISATALLGSTCYDIPLIAASGSVEVIENWMTTSCSTPEDDINRLVDYPCGSTTLCTGSIYSDFPSTTLNENDPVPPVSITITNDALISVCGPISTICIDITNLADPVTLNAPLQNISGTLDLPNGVTQFNLTEKGGGMVMMTGPESYDFTDIPAGGTLSFSVDIQADCSIPETSFNDNPFTLNFDPLCEEGAIDELTESFSFNTQIPNISMPSSTPATAETFVGDTVCITTSIINGSNAGLDTFFYCIDEVSQTNLDLAELTVAGIQLMQAPATTESGMVCYFITSTEVAAAGLNVPWSNQSLDVIEKWEVINCQEPNPEIFRRAQFGCQGNSDCRDKPDTDFLTTSISFSVPEISVVFDDIDRPACYAETPINAQFTITNNGDAPADEIVISVNGNGGALSNYMLTHSDPMETLEMGIDVITAADGCVGGDGSYRDTIRNVNLDTGETVTVNFSLSYNCACNLCSIRNIYNPSMSVLSVTDNCGDDLPGDSANGGAFNAYMDGFVEAPLNLVNGETGTVEYTVTSSELDWLGNPNYPDAYFEKVFEIPCGLDYVPGSVIFLDRNGMEYPVCSETISNDNDGSPTGEVIVRWCNNPYPAGFIISSAMEISIDVVADCDEKPTPPDCASPVYDLTIRQSAYFSTDATCTMSCERQKIQDTIDINTMIICPQGGCPCEGIVFSNFTMERTNFGMGDTNNDQVPNGSIDPNTVQSDRYLQGDTLKATFQGIINDPSGIVWQNGYAVIDFDNPNYTPLNASVFIRDADGVDHMCNAVPISVDITNDDLIVDFSLAGINANGCTPLAMSYNFDNGDSISVCVNFIVKDPFEGMQRMIIYDTEFYVSDSERGSIGHMKAQCNSRSARLTQVGLDEDESCNIPEFGACDLPDWSFNYSRHYGASGFDEFAFEIRPLGLPKEFTFIKPAEFEYRPDAFEIVLTQNIAPDNNIVNGIIPETFLVFDGDEVVFLAESYFNSLGNPEIAPDEGYTVSFRPKIQGSCKSIPNQSYDIMFSLTESVEENVYCTPMLMRAEEIKTVTYGDAALVTIMSERENVRLCAATEIVPIIVSNENTPVAVNSFLNWQSINGSVIITKIVDPSDGSEIFPNDFGIYELGDLPGNSDTRYLAYVRANDCLPGSISFVAGWDCEGYPSTVEEAICSDPSVINFNLATSAFEFEPFTPPADITPSLCDTVTFEVEFKSTDLGYVRDIFLNANFPPGLTFVPNSYKLANISANPANTPFIGTYVDQSDPTLFPGGFSTNISVLDPDLDETGLPGVKNPDSSRVSIIYKAVTNCDFINGSNVQYTVTANSNCGAPLTPVTKSSNSIFVTDEVPMFEAQVEVQDLELNPCNEDRTTSFVNLTITDGGTDVLVDSIQYILPPGLNYVTGTYMPLVNASPAGPGSPSVTTIQGSQVLTWPVDGTFAIGDVISFKLDVEAIDIGQICSETRIRVLAFSRTNTMCGMETCSIATVAGETYATVNIVKPALVFNNFEANLTLISQTNETLNAFSIEICNNGDVLQSGNTISLDIYEDIDRNGTRSFSDIFLTTISQVLTSPLGPGECITLSGEDTFDSGTVCTIIGVLDPTTTCTCSEEPSFQVRPEIIYDFQTEYEACSGDVISIGPNPVNNYAYEWLSFNGSPLSALTDPNTTMTDFSISNTSGSPITYQYVLRSSFTNCYIFDTVSVLVYPERMDVFNIEACINSSYQLPAPNISGSNYNWMPSTMGLSFPFGDSSLAVIDNVTASTTYTLNYDDEGGCPSSVVYNLIAVDCGTAVASLGDTVWFDFDMDGFQDLNEPGIASVRVNLINGNTGAVLGTTLTDANGFYIFDNLVQGNYQVEFIPLPGFIGTLQDEAMTPSQDSIDSDADPNTGITGTYFIEWGEYDPSIDAGFIPDCNLDIQLSFQPCMVSGDTLAQEVTITAQWSGNPYAYSQFGTDTLEIDIPAIGYSERLVIDTIVGDTTLTIFVNPEMDATLIASASFVLADDCFNTSNELDLTPCIFDLALRKTASNGPNFAYGDTICLDITIFNQGEQHVNNVEVVDYLPVGFGFLTDLNPIWAPSGSLYITTITDTLAPGEQVILPMKVELLMSSGVDDWTNYAEISSFQDTLGNDVSDFDIDSTPDSDPDNDPGGDPDSPADDHVDGNGTGTPGGGDAGTDEDDHDPFRVNIFDLALKKTLETPPPYVYGQPVEFKITLYNQGNITANEITVNDYIPDGFSWLMSNEPDWSFTVDGASPYDLATTTVTGPFAPGDFTEVSIFLQIEDADTDQYINIAEIASARDEDNNLRFDDFDSQPNNDPADDAGGEATTGSDNVVNGDGSGNPGDTDPTTDEDDADPALISIPIIELVKSTLGVIPASSGIEGNFDATFELVITNPGTQKLSCLLLRDDLVEQLGSRFVDITSPPMIAPLTDATEIPTIVMGFNGGVIDTIFNGTEGCLMPDQTITLQMTVELNSIGGPEPVINEAFVSGKDSFDIVVMDMDTAVVELPDCFLLVQCPIDQVSLECISDIPLDGTTAEWFNAIDGISAIENACGIPTITVNDSDNGGMGCVGDPYILTREIIVMDPGDGMTVPEADTCYITYTVIDDVKPILMNAPLDLILECGDPGNALAITNWETTNGGGVAIDACGAPAITFVAGTAVPNCGETTITPYTFTATDACGNFIVTSASIILIDSSDPTLTLPAGASSVNCTASPDPDAWAATASASDDCDTNPTVDYALINVEEICNGTTSETIYTYRFTAVDDCGNESAEQVASYTIVDDTAPVVTAPPSLNVACGQDVSLLVAEWLDDYTVFDNCNNIGDVVVTHDYVATSITNLCGTTIPVTWTLINACGASTSAMANIIIAPDTDGPTMTCLDTLRVAVDVDNCGANISVPLPTAIDCNGVDSIKQTNPLPDTEFTIGETTVTFTAWDACGNTSTCETIVVVEDTQNPQLVCPPSINRCAVDGTCTWIADASVNPVSSDCGNTTLTYSILNPDSSTSTPANIVGYAFQLGSSEITVTATDDADPMNISTCTFTVTVSDCQAPAITTCPVPQADVECGTEDIDAWASTLVATDFCDATLDTDYYLLSEAESCGNTSTLTYVFTVTDDSGNSTSCTSTYTIVDNTPPAIAPTAAGMSIECNENAFPAFLDWLNDHGGAQATDVCSSGIVTWTNDWNGVFVTGCALETDITVIFTATDDCGNTSTTSATFTISDNTDPIIIDPDDLTLQCGNPNNDDIVSVWLNSVQGNDACGGTVTITNDYSALPTTCDGSVTVTFTATDDCGLTTTTTATITLLDIEKPVIMTAPVDLVLECGDPGNALAITNWETTNGGGVAIDACGAPAITFVAGTAVPNCGETTTTPYTFTATDACGNFIVTSASIILIDSSDPTLTLPAGASSVNCTASPDPDAWAATASASDDCDTNPTVDYALINVEEICNGTTSETIYTYRFTAVDDCGNESAEQVASYTIVDDTAPVVTAPPSLNVACGQDVSLLVAEWLDDYTVFDNCNNIGDVVVTHDYVATSITNLCGTTIPVTWTLINACGASTSAMANIIIAPDTDGPTMTCLDTLRVAVDVDNCGANISVPLPTAIDCNGVDSIKQTNPLPDTEFTIGETTVTFTAWDACGNTSTCETIVVVEDTQNPQLVCPPSINRCAVDGTCTWIADASVNPVSSDCGNTTLTYSILNPDSSTSTPANIVGYAFQLGSSEITVTATDDADPMNISTCTFTVTVSDCQAPAITTCPVPQADVECGTEDIDAWASTLVATDFCDATLDTDYYLLSEAESCGNTSTLTYVFTVTDDSGNSTSCTSTYTIVDNTPPAIAPTAAGMSIECNENAFPAFLDWLNDHGGAQATDVCSSGIVTWTNDWNGVFVTGCALETDITVIFTATDDCGNTSTTSATFTISDNTDPIIIDPDDLTLQCGNPNNDDIVSVWLNSVQGNDACGGTVTITNDYSALPTTCDGSVTVTFTATDDCGLTTTTTATITLLDIEKPVIMTAPVDLVLECGDPGNALAITNWETTNGGGVAIDACGAPAITFVAGTAVPNCGETTTTPYTFTATDACGNFIVTSASIILIDSSDPTLTLPAGASSVNCTASPDPDAWAATASASDDCDTNPTVDYALINVEEICNGTTSETIYTYRFTAVDDCGNESAEQVASYTIVDDTAPVVTAPPSLNVACGQDVSLLVAEWLDDYTVFDNCNNIGDVVVTHDYVATSITNLCGTTIPVTWTLINACGASTSAMANIIIAPDTDGPTMTCLDTLRVAVDVDNCGANISVPLPTAIDCNGVDSIKQTNPLPDTEFTIGETTVTFTAWDACGNTSTCETIVVVEDTQNPQLVCPPSINRCAVDGTCTWIADASVNPVSSDCGNTTLTYSILNPDSSTSTPANIVGYAFQLGSSEITVTATDDADPMNISTCTFTVTVSDCQAPAITTCPVPQADVECGTEDIDAWASTLVATDFCDATLDTDYYLLSEAESCGNTSTLTYVFTVTDDSGNSTSCTSTYTIVDNTPPAIAPTAAGMSIECNENAFPAFLDWLNDHGGAQATDVCSSGIVTWTNDWNGVFVTGCALETDITVIFTATDDCGNTSTTSATFTISDNTDPIIIDPDDLTLQCGNPNNDDIVSVWLNSVQGNDACGGTVTITNDYSALPTTCDGSVTVTFTATDDCGLTTTTTATITLLDIEKPVIMTAPVDTILECGAATTPADIASWEANFGGGTAIDICDAMVDLSFVAGTIVETCGNTTTTEYIFTATDDCGNSISEVAYLILIDTTPPEALCVAPFTVELDDNGMYTLITDDIDNGSSDLCTDPDDLTLSILPSEFDANDLGDNIVTLTVTDGCGNTSTCTTIVTVSGSPVIGLAKRAVSLEPMGDGCTLVTYEFNIQNYGNIPIDSIQVTDDLVGAGFNDCGSFSIASLTSDDFTVNLGFNGFSDLEILSGNDVLPVGDKGSILLTVEACGCPNGTEVNNSAMVRGVSPEGEEVLDDSVDGSDPDNGDGDGNPNDDDGTTDVTFGENPILTVDKATVSVNNNGDGSYDVVYEINIENSGDVQANNIQAIDSLENTFGDPCVLDISVTSGRFTLNPGYGIADDWELLDGLDTLAAGDQGSIIINVTVDSCAMLGTFTNIVEVEGTSPGGAPLMVMDDADVVFDENPIIGLAKRITFSEQNFGGSVDITYEFRVENTGDVILDSIQVSDNLLAVFTPCAVEIVEILSDEFTPNLSYNGGISDENILAGDDILLPGEAGTIILKIRVSGCGSEMGPFENTALASGVSPAGDEVSDVSHDGAEPDPDGDGPGDDDDTTDITFDFTSYIGLAKSLQSIDINPLGYVDVNFKFILRNYGNTDLDSINLFDDVVSQFIPCDVEIFATSSSPGFTVNPLYDGGYVSDTILVGSGNALLVGETKEVTIIYRFRNCGNGDLNFCNSALATARDPLGFLTTDFSDASQFGVDPDPDGDQNPTNNNVCTMVSFGFNPAIGIAKRVSEGPTSIGNGCFDLTYEIRVENYGDQEIANIQITDALEATFMMAESWNVISVESEEFTVDTSYSGMGANTALLIGNDTLNVQSSGNEGVVYVKVNVCPGPFLGPYNNTANVTGIGLDGTPLNDASQDGPVPDPDFEGDATDNNDPTPVSFDFDPAIGVAKRVSSGPTLATNDCYDITYEIRVRNYGDVTIDSVQVTEDLNTVFNIGSDIVTVVGLESDEFMVNDDFDGVADINLLLGNDMLTSEEGGEEGTINLTLNVCPDGNTATYFNSVVASGDIPDGTMVMDSSQMGSDPNPSNTGDPNDDDEPTPFQLDCAVPTFINCGRPPIVVDAPEGWCNAFANFSPPQAEAECGLDTIIQVDNTGLGSGDLFPVGTTILKWVAQDIFGNESTDTCELKIVVNDFHTPPTIACIEDVTLNNDPLMCGAVANDIGPDLSSITDNCPDNLSISYTITDEGGMIIGTGVSDASGFKFPAGVNSVTYNVKDQPLLLITEVIQDGITSGIEITNFGPASYDISCLIIGREGTMPEEYVVGDITILPVGSTYTQLFTSINVGDPAGYYIEYIDNEIDFVALNGHVSATYSWTGTLFGSAFSRNGLQDTDSAVDWLTSNDCDATTFGGMDPNLPPLIDNMTTTSLQGKGASEASCNFTVTVFDNEPPYCSEFDTLIYMPTDLPISIGSGMCTSSIITVNENFVVGDVDIGNLQGTMSDAGDLVVKLTSPNGTRITLIDNICTGTADFDINLSDESMNTLASVTCMPMGMGDTFQPLQGLNAFIGEMSLGDWTLEILSEGPGTGSLDSWELQLLNQISYSQMDTTINNTPGMCSGGFTWQHPIASDYCGFAQLEISYFSEDGIQLPVGGIVNQGEFITETFEVGTTTIIYTLTDGAGLTSTCGGFNVTVIDIDAPVIDPLSCNDIFITLEPGECDTQVDYPILLTDDNCGIDSISYDPPIGHNFDTGTTMVTIIIFDAAGNSDTCTFNVIVEEFVPSDNGLSCSGEINLSLGGNCMAFITPEMTLLGNLYGCYEDYCLTITDLSGNIIGTNADGTNFVDLSHVGTTVIVTVCIDCDDPNSNCCSTFVNIEEKLLPDVACPPDITIQCNESDDPDFTDIPIVNSCEPDIEITYSDDYVENGICGDPRAIINRTWIISDIDGNTVICDQVITVMPFNLDLVDFPDDLIFDDALECSDVFADPALTDTSNTGIPMINGESIFGAHLCEVNVGFWDEYLDDANCSNSYEILRHWIVRDECLPLEEGINPVRHIQAIKVNDSSPPLIDECIDDVEISVLPWACTGSYLLPPLNDVFNDVCGDDLELRITSTQGTVTKSGSGIDARYTVINLPKGTHTVTINANDGCRNYSSCSFEITVVDNATPVPSCLQEIVVSLNYSGEAKLYPENIDNGSFDNCSDVFLQVAREENRCGNIGDLEWGEHVIICCNDIDQSPVKVKLRVWDDGDNDGVFGSSGDNYNECWVNVKVEYKLDPTINCVPDAVISCDNDYRDLSITGAPGAYTPCGDSEVEYTDVSVDLNPCGLGKVIRRWYTVVDNLPICDQLITIVPLDPIMEDRISFPEDTTLSCLEDVIIENPDIIGGACDQVGFSIQSDTISNDNDACYNIFNEYTVIDWCLYDPASDDGEGIWTSLQIIKVVDNVDPVITSCQDRFIDATLVDCVAESFVISAEGIDEGCSQDPYLRWIYEIDLDFDDVTDISGQLFGTSVSKEIFAQAEEAVKVSWTVTDDCGNYASCAQVLYFRDNKAPTPYCQNVAIPISSDGSVEVWASDFNVGSFDNCTSSDQLRFSFSGEEIITNKTFTCGDIINGVDQSIDVQMWVWDKEGNKEFCVARLDLQDNGNFCPDASDARITIAGVLGTEYGETLDDAFVMLESDGPEYPFEKITGANGYFEFNGNPVNADYTLSAEKLDDHMNGVSTLDLVLIQRHILGLDLLDSPYKVIASDINNNLKVSSSDILELRRTILGITADFPNNSSWRFVERNSAFEDYLRPFPIVETITYNDLKVSQKSSDFIAVKIGDVNGNADANSRHHNVTVRSEKDISLNYDIIKEGNMVEIPLYLEEDANIFGFQMTLDEFQGDKVRINSGQMTFNEDNYYHDGKSLRISWDGVESGLYLKDEPLFTIVVEESSVKLLKKGNDLYSEMYLTSSLDIHDITLRKRISAVKNMKVLQNEPNPFNNQTEIPVYMPQGEKVRLEILDGKGSSIISEIHHLQKGDNRIRFVNDDRLAPGVYYYKVISKEDVITKKMVIVR